MMEPSSLDERRVRNWSKDQVSQEVSKLQQQIDSLQRQLVERPKPAPKQAVTKRQRIYRIAFPGMAVIAALVTWGVWEVEHNLAGTILTLAGSLAVYIAIVVTSISDEKEDKSV